MNNAIIPMPAKLIRTLSEQHWQAALEELEQRGLNQIEAGSVSNMDGEINWVYYLVRNGNILERHIISHRHNIHEIITIR